MLTGEFVETWGWQPEYGADTTYGYRGGLYHPNARVSNNHPAILPFTADTHGNGAHQKTIDLYKAGRVKHSAMTWHLASGEIDKGPIIDEEPEEIYTEDTADSLGGRIQGIEKDLTGAVIEKHLIMRAEHQRGNS